MIKLYLRNRYLSLLFAVLLSACTGTTQVVFEPAPPEPPPTAQAEAEAAAAAEAAAEAAAAAEQEVAIAEPAAPEGGSAQPPPAAKPYPLDIASTAEQLYGTDPNAPTSPEYTQAAQADPTLGYTIIYFDFNQSEVKADGRELLSRHASFMEANPEIVLRVEGHADQRGTSGYNLALGEARANAVRTLLEAYGIDGSRVSVISYGEEQPAVDGNSEEAFRLNRRAELIYP